MSQLEPFGESIWTVSQPFKLLGFDFGTRATLLRRDGRKLLLFSTVKPNQDLLSEIDALGTLELIVAPSAFHTTYLESFQNHYPQARLLAAPSVQKKRPRLKIAGNVSEITLGEWGEEVKAFRTRGSKANEWILYHRISKTLMITDIAFNFRQHNGAWDSFIQTLFNVKGRLTPSRLYKTIIKDKKAFRETLELILKEKIDQITLPHGELIRSNGGVELRAAYQWLYE